jgi:hypothetical protein
MQQHLQAAKHQEWLQHSARFLLQHQHQQQQVLLWTCWGHKQLQVLLLQL